MKRTLENCSLIIKIGIKPIQSNGKCEGFGTVDEEDICEICKKCNLNIYQEENNE